MSSITWTVCDIILVIICHYLLEGGFEKYYYYMIRQLFREIITVGMTCVTSRFVDPVPWKHHQ